MKKRLLVSIRVPAGLLMAFVAVVNAIAMGIHAPGTGVLASLPPGLAVDYSPIRGGLAPLQPSFIEDVLGSAAPEQVASARALTPRPPLGAVSPPLARILDEHPATNDRLEQARAIPRPPFTARTNTSRATRSADDPADCGSVGGTVWYRYRAGFADGLIANTFGTPGSVTLGVYEGAPGALTTVGCDTDVQGNAVLAFTAKQGSEYFFQIAGPAGGGSLVFSLDLQGRTTLESVSAAGEPGDNISAGSSLSGDGRIVVFSSLATNLVPGLSAEPCLTTPPYALGVTHTTNKVVNGTSPCIQLFARDRAAGRTVLVTASPDGKPGNAHTSRANQDAGDRSYYGGGFVSENGRYVAFASEASNLVDDDTNLVGDAFVRDLLTGKTERVSLDWRGRQVGETTPVGSASWVSISHDGRYVVFTSFSSEFLPPGQDTNLSSDVLVRDRLLGTTTRVSVSSSGEQTEPLSDLASVDNHGRSNTFPMTPCISGNGRYIAFRSGSSTLVPNDTNQAGDIFVHDQITHTTERVSVGPEGRQADLGSSSWPGCLSHDGRYVVFTSRATNLVDGDTNGAADVFVRDRLLGVTRRVSVNSDGSQSQTGDRLFRARVAVISANGRYVAFHSIASDLAEGDQNTFSDVFIHDLVTGASTRVSSKPGGGEFSDADAFNPSISADGRIVAFDAAPSGVHLRPVESVAPAQVYVHERSRSEP